MEVSGGVGAVGVNFCRFWDPILRPIARLRGKDPMRSAQQKTSWQGQHFVTRSETHFGRLGQYCLYSKACQNLKRMPKVIRRKALAEDKLRRESSGGGGGRQFLQFLGPYFETHFTVSWQ